MKILLLVMIQTIITLRADNYWAEEGLVGEVSTPGIKEEARYSPYLPWAKRIQIEKARKLNQNIQNILEEKVSTFSI